MKVGIIGSGGREHAICDALTKSKIINVNTTENREPQSHPRERNCVKKVFLSEPPSTFQTKCYCLS